MYSHEKVKIKIFIFLFLSILFGLNVVNFFLSFYQDIEEKIRYIIFITLFSISVILFIYTIIYIIYLIVKYKKNKYIYPPLAY